MRFRLTLRRLSQPCNLPINYQPYISAGIYRLLEQADASYSYFLHNEGYKETTDQAPPFLIGLSKVFPVAKTLTRQEVLLAASRRHTASW